MSVIQYETKDFDQLRDWLVFDVSKSYTNSVIRHVVTNSQPYREYYFEQVQVTGKKPDEDELAVSVVEYMVHYAEIANRVCFATQYRETANCVIEHSETNPSYKDKYFIVERMGRIDYNLYTNAGTCFMPEKYRQLWEAVLHAYYHKYYRIERERIEDNQRTMRENRERAESLKLITQ